MSYNGLMTFRALALAGVTGLTLAGRAARACLRLQPKGARATARQPTAAQQQAMLRFARCMRSHGVPNFPDPQPGGALDLAQKVAAPNSPQFKATEHTCRNFVPDAPIPAAPSTRKPTP
jgi:hypothetical protein